MPLYMVLLRSVHVCFGETGKQYDFLDLLIVNTIKISFAQNLDLP